jgi:hypothetical protein
VSRGKGGRVNCSSGRAGLATGACSRGGRSIGVTGARRSGSGDWGLWPTRRKLGRGEDIYTRHAGASGSHLLLLTSLGSELLLPSSVGLLDGTGQRQSVAIDWRLGAFCVAHFIFFSK